MSGWVLDALIVTLLGGLALWATIARETFAAIVAFIAFGLLASLAWVRLGGIDVALTEAAIGGGATGVLVLQAAARLGTDAEPARPGAMHRTLAAVLCTLVAGGLGWVMLNASTPPPTLAPAAVAHLAPSGLENPVAGVLMTYRAVDTLLEAIVLAFALLGVWAVGDAASWGGVPVVPGQNGSDATLALAARALIPIGIVVGIYIAWIGSFAPGGKFQAGTVLAAMWLLAWRAGLMPPPPVAARWLRWALVTGPLLFLAIGLAGIPLAGAFLAYPDGGAKPLILAIEATMTVSVAVGLAMMLAGPAAVR